MIRFVLAVIVTLIVLPGGLGLVCVVCDALARGTNLHPFIKGWLLAGGVVAGAATIVPVSCIWAWALGLLDGKK